MCSDYSTRCLKVAKSSAGQKTLKHGIRILSDLPKTYFQVVNDWINTAFGAFGFVTDVVGKPLSLSQLPMENVDLYVILLLKS